MLLRIISRATAAASLDEHVGPDASPTHSCFLMRYMPHAAYLVPHASCLVPLHAPHMCLMRNMECLMHSCRIHASFRVRHMPYTPCLRQYASTGISWLRHMPPHAPYATCQMPHAAYLTHTPRGSFIPVRHIIASCLMPPCLKPHMAPSMSQIG